MRISLKIHANHVKRNGTCWFDGRKYLLPSKKNRLPADLSRLSYRIAGGGLNPPQGIRNLFLIEFTLCHIPIRDACTWNSSWIETRNALLSRPSIPTADPSFRTGYMDYFRIFHESQVCCARARDTEFAKLKLWRIVGYFFKHYEVEKLYFDLLFYRNFQNCVIR